MSAQRDGSAACGASSGMNGSPVPVSTVARKNNCDSDPIGHCGREARPEGVRAHPFATPAAGLPRLGGALHLRRRSPRVASAHRRLGCRSFAHRAWLRSRSCWALPSVVLTSCCPGPSCVLAAAACWLRRSPCPRAICAAHLKRYSAIPSTSMESVRSIEGLRLREMKSPVSGGLSRWISLSGSSLTARPASRRSERGGSTASPRPYGLVLSIGMALVRACVVCKDALVPIL